MNDSPVELNGLATDLIKTVASLSHKLEHKESIETLRAPVDPALYVWVVGNFATAARPSKVEKL